VGFAQENFYGEAVKEVAAVGARRSCSLVLISDGYAILVVHHDFYGSLLAKLERFFAQVKNKEFLKTPGGKKE
jgi:hypothetical protein